MIQKPTILCVDDEANVLSSLQRALHREGYRIIVATSGQEGLEHLENESPQIIISDQRMPNMCGTDFLQKARTLCPDAIRIMLSGYAELGSVVDAINKGEVYRFLSKPWNDEELKETIQQCLLQYDLTHKLMKSNSHSSVAEEIFNGNTKRLYQAQEILQQIPIGTIALNGQYQIFFANNPAIAILPRLETLTNNAPIFEFFTSEIKHYLDSINDNITVSCVVNTIGDNRPTKLAIKRCRMPESGNGYLIFLTDTYRAFEHQTMHLEQVV